MSFNCNSFVRYLLFVTQKCPKLFKSNPMLVKTMIDHVLDWILPDELENDSDKENRPKSQKYDRVHA